MRILPPRLPQPITTSSPFTSATLPCRPSPTAVPHTSLFVRQTPKSYIPSKNFRPIPADHNSKSPMGSSSSPLHLDSSRSPTPTSQSARTYSATTTSPITSSVLRHYCGTAKQPPSPTTISPYIQRATSSCTVPKPHDPTLGVFLYPDRRTFARRPSSDTNSTPRSSSSPTPLLDHHRIRRSSTPSNVDGYTTIPTSPQIWSAATNHTCQPTLSVTSNVLVLASGPPDLIRSLRKY